MGALSPTWKCRRGFHICIFRSPSLDSVAVSRIPQLEVCVPGCLKDGSRPTGSESFAGGCERFSPWAALCCLLSASELRVKLIFWKTNCFRYLSLPWWEGVHDATGLLPTLTSVLCVYIFPVFIMSFAWAVSAEVRKINLVLQATAEHAPLWSQQPLPF